MNILIPHHWLLEQLETDISPTELQEKLSLCGPSIERIYDREGDSVYDIEVTTNRVDSMSVRGIAREAAVILSQFGDKAKLKPLKLNKPSTPQDQLPLPKITNQPDVCPRILCVVLKDVKRAATPDWMAKRLRQIDINVHDAVIDITNYITHELGHPCHAFDYDKIMELGGEIIVTEANKGESFTTLDGETYETVGGEIVFKNPAGQIIDLPAIKGTLNSSINDHTKNVLFWVESLDAKKVRFASMTHAIRTVAAQLNEKKVDPHLGEQVLLRGIELYQELCDAQVASEIYDEFPGEKKSPTVKVKLATIHNYLGLELPTGEIVSILEALGCEVELEGKDHLAVVPPTFRPDIRIPADIVEEIARIYGYHKLPSTLMATPIPTTKPEGTDYHLENRIKHFLADIGWQEVYTYSMVSKKIAEASGMAVEDHLALANPLTDDRVYLRRSLLPSLQEVLTQNHHQQLSVFELAMTYVPQTQQLPIQELQLAMVSNSEYRVVKGTLESLLAQFFVTANFEVQDKPGLEFAQAATIKVGKTELGTIGVLHSGEIGVVVEIKQLLTVAQSHPTYQPLPKTSLIKEDLTFTLPAKTAVGEVIEALYKTSELIRQVELKDMYQQNATLSITYHDPFKNLSGEEVTPIRQKIVALAEEQFKAKLVGKLE